MILIDEPSPVALNDYWQAISRMTQRVAALPSVRSLYQIGGLSSPGISDIDMVVVFEDNVSFLQDLRQDLSDTDRYLFVHNLFGTSVSHFTQSRHYTFFHNFRLLYGEDMGVGDEHSGLAGDDMRRQWAGEFLVRMLINMAIEREFRIYKIRSLLLQGKALIYDLEFLKANAPALRRLLDQIILWRQEWFERRPATSDICSLFGNLWNELTGFLQSHLNAKRLFLPPLLPGHKEHRFAHNINLRAEEQVRASSRGPKIRWLPATSSTGMLRKLIGLQHRLNRFEVTLPFTTDNVPTQVAESFEYNQRATSYNQQYLPHFMPLTSSLSIT